MTEDGYTHVAGFCPKCKKPIDSRLDDQAIQLYHHCFRCCLPDKPRLKRPPLDRPALDGRATIFR